MLAAIVGAVVATQIGVAVGVAVRFIGSQCRIVAGSVLEIAIVLRMMAEAIVGIACAVFRTDAKTFVLGAGDEWWNAVVVGVVRCRRRTSGVVTVRRASSHEKRGQSNREKCSTGEFHDVLAILIATCCLSACVRIGKRSIGKNVVVSIGR